MDVSLSALIFISRYFWGHFRAGSSFIKTVTLWKQTHLSGLIWFPASATVASDHRRYAADLRRSSSLWRSTHDGVDDRRPSSRRSRRRFIRRRFLGILHCDTISMHLLSFGPVAALYLVHRPGRRSNLLRKPSRGVNPRLEVILLEISFIEFCSASMIAERMLVKW